MLKRKVTELLETWKRQSQKALLVTGARQVGKSYAIREFGKRSYAVYFEVNLLLERESARILSEAVGARDFINRVALLSDTPLIEGNTLIFIDEIQEYPDIVTLIKALVEDGRYSYVFSGSMLGNDLKGITSFPVGYAEQIVMRPLEFEVFYWEFGVSQRSLEDVRLALVQRNSLVEFVHQAMMKNYRSYIVCGGMPEVVQAYVDSGYSLARTRELQSSLVRQYGQDIGKYAGGRALATRAIYDRIPVELEGDSHRFKLTSLKNGRYDRYEHDFLWLVNAGVGLRVIQATEALSPLRRTERPSMFKLYQSDTGMLVSRFSQSTARGVYLNRADVNLGGVFENVVAQELTALDIPLFYYSNLNVGEVDFLIEGQHGHVLPLEGKSGNRLRSHAALDALLESPRYKIPFGVVLSQSNLSLEGNVLYVPLYMTFCLDELTDAERGDFTFAPAVL